MNKPTLVQPCTANAAVDPFLIVKYLSSGTVEGLVLPAAASTDLCCGISTDIRSEIAEPCDVIIAGAARVRYGGTVARGAKLTADATGRAVTAAPGAGVNAQIIGIAMISGVIDDIGEALIAPSVMQG